MVDRNTTTNTTAGGRADTLVRPFEVMIEGEVRRFLSGADAEAEAKRLYDAAMTSRDGTKRAFIELGRFLLGLKSRTRTGEWMWLLRRCGIHQKRAERAMRMAGMIATSETARRLVEQAGSVYSAAVKLGVQPANRPRAAAQATAIDATTLSHDVRQQSAPRSDSTMLSNRGRDTFVPRSDLTDLSNRNWETLAPRSDSTNLSNRGRVALGPSGVPGAKPLASRLITQSHTANPQAWTATKPLASRPVVQLTFDEIYGEVESLRKRAAQVFYRHVSAGELRGYAAAVLELADKIEARGGGGDSDDDGSGSDGLT